MASPRWKDRPAVTVTDMTPQEIEAAIYAAYTRNLSFPADWTDEDRHVFVVAHVAPVVEWVLDEYDNIVDDWVEWGHRTQRPAGDVCAAIESSREQLLKSAFDPHPDEVPNPRT